MASGKRYYWIKLRESFMNGDVVDFLMSQKDGANYVVLYLLLCMKTINTDGHLSRKIGEILIPFDVEKIQRDCKWFSIDTIRIALNLYKKCGLIYEDQDGVLAITDYDNLVGSETDAAARMRNSRAARNALPAPNATDCEQSANNVTPEIRDKDTRYKSSDTGERVQEKEGGGGNPFGDNDHHRRPDFNTLEAYASSNLRYMSPYNLEELISFRDSLPDELIRYAIDEACANGKPEYSYARSILNRYVDSGFRTIGDVKAHEAKRRQAQQGKASGSYDYSGDDESNPYKGW